MKTHFRHFSVMVAMLGFSAAACAQYVWLDENGRKQFSDMPPPADVPLKRILKEPERVVAPEAPPAPEGTTDPDAPPPPVKAPLPMTTAEKNAEFQRRQIEQAEKDKKAAEKARADSARAKDCQRAREYSRALESGERMVHTDPNGEKVFMGDEQRMQEMSEARRMLENCK